MPSLAAGIREAMEPLERRRLLDDRFWGGWMMQWMASPHPDYLDIMAVTYGFRPYPKWDHGDPQAWRSLR